MDENTVERYDRQIRLWGQEGQNKCSISKICLINCDSLGLEILKGLCLAGIGSYTILDSHKLMPEDVGCSFLPLSSVGKNRGESAKTMLSDMNADVSGEVLPLEAHLPLVTNIQQSDTDTDLSEENSVIQDRDFWKQFNCVIVSGTIYLGQLIRLSKICWALNTPLIFCKSIGFYGSMRNQIKEHIVLDTHPEWRPPNHDPTKPDTLVLSNTRPVHEEYEDEVFKYQNDDNENDFITIYVCLKALDIFFSTYGRLPGCRNDQVETDIGKLKDCVKKMIGKSSIQLKTLDQGLYEVCRYGGAELHATSAFMGGCVAQEVIKIITNQYVPTNDTIVYNAMSATTRHFKFCDLFSQA